MTHCVTVRTTDLAVISLPPELIRASPFLSSLLESCPPDSTEIPLHFSYSTTVAVARLQESLGKGDSETVEKRIESWLSTAAGDNVLSREFADMCRLADYFGLEELLGKMLNGIAKVVRSVQLSDSSLSAGEEYRGKYPWANSFNPF